MMAVARGIGLQSWYLSEQTSKAICIFATADSYQTLYDYIFAYKNNIKETVITDRDWIRHYLDSTGNEHIEFHVHQHFIGYS